MARQPSRGLPRDGRPYRITLYDMEKLQDLRDAECTLYHQLEALDELFAETEGEVTPETDAVEAAMNATKRLILTDGIDLLGRILVSEESKLAMHKAEKAYADRKVKSTQKSIDFFKSLIVDAMKLTGVEKVKGTYYGFTAYVSEKTTLDTDQMDERWLDAVTEAARNAGLPGYIDVALKTTATRVKEWAQTHEGQGDMYLITDTADAVRFTKPRKAKED